MFGVDQNLIKERILLKRLRGWSLNQIKKNENGAISEKKTLKKEKWQKEELEKRQAPIIKYF